MNVVFPIIVKHCLVGVTSLDIAKKKHCHFVSLGLVSDGLKCKCFNKLFVFRPAWMLS